MIIKRIHKLHKEDELMAIDFLSYNNDRCTVVYNKYNPSRVHYINNIKMSKNLVHELLFVNRIIDAYTFSSEGFKSFSIPFEEIIYIYNFVSILRPKIDKIFRFSKILNSKLIIDKKFCKVFEVNHKHFFNIKKSLILCIGEHLHKNLFIDCLTLEILNSGIEYMLKKQFKKTIEENKFQTLKNKFSDFIIND